MPGILDYLNLNPRGWLDGPSLPGFEVNDIFGREHAGAANDVPL